MNLRSMIDTGGASLSLVDTKTLENETLIEHGERHGSEMATVSGPEWISTRIDHPTGVSIVTTTLEPGETTEQHVARHMGIVLAYIEAL